MNDSRAVSRGPVTYRGLLLEAAVDELLLLLQLVAELLLGPLLLLLQEAQLPQLLAPAWRQRRVRKRRVRNDALQSCRGCQLN